jgi:hypothetical protein
MVIMVSSYRYYSSRLVYIKGVALSWDVVPLFFCQPGETGTPGTVLVTQIVHRLQAKVVVLKCVQVGSSPAHAGGGPNSKIIFNACYEYTSIVKAKTQKGRECQLTTDRQVRKETDYSRLEPPSSLGSRLVPVQYCRAKRATYLTLERSLQVLLGFFS